MHFAYSDGLHGLQFIDSAEGSEKKKGSYSLTLAEDTFLSVIQGPILFKCNFVVK